MKDSVLKKEFAPRDVQRMRNLISGNTGDRTQLQAGWEKSSQTHKEGDIWEESGRKWIIKDGLKQTVTKFDSIKRLAILPITCPNCKKPMKLTDLNKKMWAIHSTCFDCVIEKEEKIKREGKWDEYSAQVMNANKNESLTDLEQALESWMDIKESFVTEDGEVQAWDGGDKTESYKQVKEYIAKLRDIDIYNTENT